MPADGPQPLRTSLVVNFGTSSGNVTLVEKNPAGQTSTITVAINVGTTTAIQVPSAETSIKIYPVPCTEKITIELNESTSTNVSYTLVDAVGQVVTTKTVVYSGNSLDIDMPFASGMYQLILTWNNHTSIQKIIKQ